MSWSDHLHSPELWRFRALLPDKLLRTAWKPLRVRNPALTKATCRMQKHEIANFILTVTIKAQPFRFESAALRSKNACRVASGSSWDQLVLLSGSLHHTHLSPYSKARISLHTQCTRPFVFTPLDSVTSDIYGFILDYTYTKTHLYIIFSLLFFIMLFICLFQWLWFKKHSPEWNVYRELCTFFRQN